MPLRMGSVQYVVHLRALVTGTGASLQRRCAAWERLRYPLCLHAPMVSSKCISVSPSHSSPPRCSPAAGHRPGRLLEHHLEADPAVRRCAVPAVAGRRCLGCGAAGRERGSGACSALHAASTRGNLQGPMHCGACSACGLVLVASTSMHGTSTACAAPACTAQPPPPRQVKNLESAWWVSSIGGEWAGLCTRGRHAPRRLCSAQADPNLAHDPPSWVFAPGGARRPCAAWLLLLHVALAARRARAAGHRPAFAMSQHLHPAHTLPRHMPLVGCNHPPCSGHLSDLLHHRSGAGLRVL